MKKMMLAAAAMMVMGGTAQAAPADWVVLRVTANIAKPANTAWNLIGGNDWCGIAKYLAIKSCRIDKGTGAVGSIRIINGTLLEIAVARTPLSYTYAQPEAKTFYHGTMAVEPVNATHSRLVYTMMWNQAALPDQKARTEAYEGRRTRFQAAVNKMAAHADAAK